MQSTAALTQLVDQPAIDELADPLSKAIRGVYEAAGPAGQQIKNATLNQPCLMTRERDGRIEVRLP